MIHVSRILASHKAKLKRQRAGIEQTEATIVELEKIVDDGQQTLFPDKEPVPPKKKS